MKVLFDFLPIILFFVAFKIAGIYWATAVAIAASVLQILGLRLRRRPIEALQWFSLAVIVVFGGLTLLLHNETFIKWKPSILYGSFAALLIGGAWWGQDFLRLVIGKQLTLPDAIWRRLNQIWAGFFAVMAILNLWVAYGFSTETWVNFKLFGTVGLTMAFAVAQGLWLSRHIEDDPPTAPVAPESASSEGSSDQSRPHNA